MDNPTTVSNTHEGYETLTQPQPIANGRKALSIGLPRCMDSTEKRFPLTPEGVRSLTDRGIDVRIEQRAGETIHYTDNQYAAAGARVGTRDEALSADIVVHLAPLAVADLRRMRRGAMLLTLFALHRQTPAIIRELISRSILAVALDLIEDTEGNTPFADILAEIDGRTAIARASSLLADADHGKGILLGGIAGVEPCEVLVIGSGIAACAAARSAIGLGTIVRMLDHDVYSLRAASRQLGPGVVVSSIHPRALESALRTADVVVHTAVAPAVTIGEPLIDTTKRGVVIFDLSTRYGEAFPSLPTVDLAESKPIGVTNSAAKLPNRVCYVNAGSLVPRTAAMALSDSFITMLHDILACEGLTNALKLLPGFQKAAYTFSGKAVNSEIATIAGTRHVDINIYLTLS